ncbi:MAG: 4'-phosphopantetheinyl transferase superfamily protein [Gammaproteobacteria bacterium]|nr:4'-phosphopantetheinyl transferase superfamily protein [Gammaproteobacteria bacterium]
MQNHIIPPPQRQHADIWQIALTPPANDPDDLLALLDNEETARYQQLHHKHKSRYLLSHVACRQILSRYTQLAASEIVYRKNDYGKPYLNHNSPIRFNLSHSHNLAVIAISAHAEIGVDLEYMERKNDWAKLARRFFSAEEIEDLFQQQQENQRTRFFQLWTRKEAFIKALGSGLSTPLNTFNVCTNPVTELLAAANNKPDWYHQDLEISAPYQASLIQCTPIEKIRYYSYP